MGHRVWTPVEIKGEILLMLPGDGATEGQRRWREDKLNQLQAMERAGGWRFDEEKGIQASQT